MNIQAVNRCRSVLYINNLVAKANGKAAEWMGCEKGTDSVRFLVNPLYASENPEMLTSPYKFVQEIKKGLKIMKTAEANCLYRDISNELL